MKKVALTMCVIIGLSACVHEPVECNRPSMAMAEPVIQTTTPSGCQGSSYTVSEPIEILYKNTTYKTVYEPKTYSSVSYVKKPYNCAEDRQYLHK